eukprot:CAMPEP_0181050400 /NCGR_PEP_ID=MMETSP1070-20121207/16496_1 /TAXON_ID=265543 /ORGANISM="Minutocellus polymorphus, Strain NH13" /LENGTH=60 /DNA_ID=CAMNT_0023129343 /DNA_START=466 /DNA_END=648 /DNA_ORIENTATION=+
MVVRGEEGVDEMDEHKDRWLPLPPVDAEASSYDVENNDAEWDAVESCHRGRRGWHIAALT